MKQYFSGSTTNSNTSRRLLVLGSSRLHHLESLAGVATSDSGTKVLVNIVTIIIIIKVVVNITIIIIKVGIIIIMA